MENVAEVPTWEERDRTNGEAELEVALPYLIFITKTTLGADGPDAARLATESYTPKQRQTLLAALLSMKRSVGLLVQGVAGMVVQDAVNSLDSDD